MKCFGKYDEYDKVCDLCYTTNNKEALKCISKTLTDSQLKEILNCISRRCPYLGHNTQYGKSWEVCYLNGNKYEDTSLCKPSLSCEKYSKVNNSID